MKKLILAVAVAGAFAGGVAHAQEAASPHSFTGNFTLASDYRFRGVSQTDKSPAVQGGFDYEHSSGFYVGNWNSNIDFAKSIEMDLYAGYKFAITEDFGMDVGVLYYYYPGTKRDGGTNYNTQELYVAGSYKWLTAKYSQAISKTVFGYDDARGSNYLELGAAIPLAEKVNLNLHVGKTNMKNYSGDDDYLDYSIGVDYDLGFATVALTAYDTDKDNAYSTGTSKKVAGSGAVFSISKSF
ncbi:MAG: TorF family putative porin [Oxalicibacterium faecigallinarum]|nr:TorF family putative porin [Oxalicibacterium faecigallinarum]MDQ7969439.1 TorF family putative porin [Oxalicibacterium faecigallinarum]